MSYAPVQIQRLSWKRNSYYRGGNARQTNEGNNMSKITIEFDSYEQREEMLAAINATSTLSAVCDADNRLRSYQKYSNGTLEEAEQAISEAREMLWEAQQKVEG